MMKSYFKIILIGLFIGFTAFLQAQVLSFHHGKVAFYTSSMVSDIDAISEEVAVKLDLSTGTVDIKIPIQSFEFEYEMMQDHFNEEYLESDKYPDATFQGKVTQDLSNIVEKQEIDVSGALTIHGVSKEITFKATIEQKEGFTLVKCKFPIVFKDFKVEEPSILTKSVATDVEVKGVLYLN